MLFDFFFSVESMYVYEGRDYSKETTDRDQQAFDNMVAGEVALVKNVLSSKMRQALRTPLLPCPTPRDTSKSLVLPRCQDLETLDCPSPQGTRKRRC